MKKISILLALAVAWIAVPAQSQPDITGTWTGDLDLGGGASLEVHFILTREADGYSAVLTSPDQGAIEDVAATSTSFDGGQLVITVDDVAGRYEGRFANGGFEGSWHQQGQAMPLQLSPWVESVLTDADKELLRGSWVGELAVQGITLAIVFRFEDDASGEFAGFLDSPDQAATGVPMAGIQLEDGNLSFSIPQISGSYDATVTPDGMVGTFRQAGLITEPLNMARGEYISRGLELAPEAAARLEGSWVGKVATATGVEVTLVVRFEPAEGGGTAAFLDSPDQGASGIPISEVTLEGDQLDLVIPTVQGSLSATLSDDAITGTWAQGTNATPVTLERGEYVPQVVALDISDGAYEQLAGEWTGVLNSLPVILRIETNENNLRVATFESPQQDSGRLPVPLVALEGDQVSIATTFGGAFSGTLVGDSMTGTWTQAGMNFDLSLSR